MKNNSALSLTQTVSIFLLQALVVLSPLLVIPYTRNLIIDTKTGLLFVAALVVSLSFAVKTVVRKKWELAASPLALPLSLFGLAVLLSSFFSGKYPVESLLGVGGAYLSFVLVSLLGSSLVKGNYTQKVITLLAVSGAILSISMVLEYFGWGPTHLMNAVSAFELPHNLLFNLSGSSFIAAQVIAIALVGLVVGVLAKKSLTAWDLSLGTVNLFGLVLGIWSLLPGKIAAITFAPLQASWTVMIRSLESLPSALIGHGPAAYANLYARFKPLWVNGQSYWQFNFGSATNTPLTLMVTLGILGTLAWLFLVVKTFMQLKTAQKESKPLLWMLLATFAVQLFAPTNLVILSLQAALFVFWTAANQSHFSLLQFRTWKVSSFSFPKKLEFLNRFLGGKKNWLADSGALVMVVAIVVATYLIGRAYWAYHLLYRANAALLKNDAVQVYENQRIAVQTNPYLDTIRREYALTNLQVAIALSNNTNITEEEQQQVIQLISQAIREGKAATLLDPADVDNWTTLAEVYRNLIGASDQASEWAVNSLVSAVQVNPTNPNLRLEIGRLALADDKAEDAIRFFAQAAELKPDMPAAYYQLGLAFQQLNQPEDTKKAWQQALTLLQPDSSDYATLTAQLSELEQNAPKQGASTPGAAGNTGASTGSGSANSGAEAASEKPSSTPNITEQNVQQQEADIVKPSENLELQ